MYVYIYIYIHMYICMRIYLYIRRASGPRRCEIKKNNSLYRGFTPSYNPPPGRSWDQKLARHGVAVA